MKITITEILKETPTPVGRQSAKDIWVNFSAEHTEGSAIFVPHSSVNISAMLGKTFYVELSHEKIMNFQRHLIDSTNCSFTPLAEKGNYKVTGQVSTVCRFDDETQPVAIDIAIHDIFISIYPDEITTQLPDMGETVSFDLIGLSLWDENY